MLCDSEIWLQAFVDILVACLAGKVCEFSVSLQFFEESASRRRHFVAWSNATPGDFAEGYWNKIWDWYNAGGDRDVAAFLAGYTITDFDPKAPPPKTLAFWDIVEANSAPEDTELADVLDRLNYPHVVLLRHVINAADPEFGRWLRERKNRRSIPYRFEKAGYVLVRRPGVDDGLWRVTGKKQVIYAKKELSLNEQILAAEELVRKEAVPKDLLDE
jgi:hypothetical protein